MAITSEDILESFDFILNRKKITSEYREYLGISQMGNNCANYLWLTFRWAKARKITTRQERLFGRGHIEEERIIKELKSIGYNVESQQEEIIDAEGHIRGHIDSTLLIPELSEKFLVEFKGLNDRWFNTVKSKKLKNVFDEYYAQTCTYAYYKEYDKILFIIINKNTEELYFEIINVDKDFAIKNIKRGVDIVNSPVPMEKVSNDPSYFKCKAFKCEFYSICHENDNYDKNCRTCSKSSPYYNGKWFCEEHDKEITIEEQKLGCDLYDMIKG
jgi:hypothetical protein